MSKLRVISQPLKVSDRILDELENEIQDYWDHKVESMAIRQAREQRRSFREEI